MDDINWYCNFWGFNLHWYQKFWLLVRSGKEIRRFRNFVSTTKGADYDALWEMDADGNVHIHISQEDLDKISED